MGAEPAWEPALMAITFKRIATPGRNLQHEAELATAQEDAQALADVGLGPTPTLPPPQTQNAPRTPPGEPRAEPARTPPMVPCAGCGRAFPADPEQGDLSQAVKNNVSLGFAPDEEVVVTNSLFSWNTRYKAGDTGVVLSCRLAGSTPRSRYTLVEVRMDKPRERGHDTVWLHIWELDRKCP